MQTRVHEESFQAPLSLHDSRFVEERSSEETLLTQERLETFATLPRGTKGDSLGERLARIEEQVKAIGLALGKLGRRDDELDGALRSMSERLTRGLAEQSEAFREALERLPSRYASREDVAMVKGLVLAAFGALSAYGWHLLTGGGR